VSSSDHGAMVRSVIALLAICIALTACTRSGSAPSVAASSPSPGSTTTQSTPPAHTLPGTIAIIDRRVKPGWQGAPRHRAALISPTRLGMVTMGSGSCPWLPTSLQVVGPSMITMHLRPYRGPCTMDYRTTYFEVAVDPAQIDVAHPLTINTVYSAGGRVVSRETLHAAALN
jgi:hypothetical protein